jgi:pimeloyl-ACP methyl ester carboxylesterase
MVAEGRGRELILMPGWWYVISAESFLDRMTEMPDILELAPLVRCPVLYIRGDQESAENYPGEAFRERAGGPCDVWIIPDCDHFYNGREGAVTKAVASWLARLVSDHD